MKPNDKQKFTIAEILTNFSQKQAQMQQEKMLKQQLKEALMKNQASALGQFVPGMADQMQAPEMNPEDMGFDEYYQQAKRGGIKLDPRKKGTFKAQATRMGMSVQQAAAHILANKEKYSPAMVKKANFARNFAKEEGGEMMQYEPGGDWPPLKKGAVYVNPLYMGNFVGGNNSYDTLTGENARFDIYNPYSASSFNVGVQLPLSKNRRIDSEKTKGWMMDAYVGMPYSQMIGKDAKFLPSAGIKFDYENSPQNDPTYGFRKFRPFVNLGAEYSPTDGFGVGAFGGGRTPFGKKVRPGYGAGHMDAYAGFQGGANLGEGKFQLSPIIGGRIKGEYMPERRSFLNKVLGDDVSIFGEAGATANFFKGKMTQRETPDTEVVATGWDSNYGGPDFGTQELQTKSQNDAVGVGFDVYGNVGLKKKFSDFDKKKTANKTLPLYYIGMCRYINRIICSDIQ